MSEQMNTEIWVSVREKASRKDVIAVSNKGNIKYGDGSIRPAKIYARIMVDRKHKHVSHLIAEHFVGKTEDDIRLGRDIVDHITHNPVGMNVNDARNLRWCTHKENSNFPEAKRNMMAGMTGIARTEFGQQFLPTITGKVRGANRKYYAWAWNQYKTTGIIPSQEEYSHVHKGRKSAFSQWFNDKYGPGIKNRALYQKCYRHYKTTGSFLEV